jgi:hypothetical protein
MLHARHLRVPCDSASDAVIAIHYFAGALGENDWGVAVRFADYSGCTDCNGARRSRAVMKKKPKFPELTAHRA